MIVSVIAESKVNDLTLLKVVVISALPQIAIFQTSRDNDHMIISRNSFILPDKTALK